MVVPAVTNWLQAIMVSLAAALMTFLSFIPALIGAIVILVVGWLISGWVGKLVTALLERIGFERAASRTGVSGFISKAGVQDARASRVVGELVKWFIRLLFLEAAAEAVHLSAVTQVLNSIVLFIPNLIVALLVLMVGALIARFVGDMVRGSASEMGFSNPNLLATISRFAIMAFAVIVAVNQIGIAATLVNTMFMAVVGAAALAIGLAFGLGGRDTAARMWQQWYQRGQEMAPRLEHAAETAAQRAEDRVQQTGEAPAPVRQPAQVEPQRRYRVSPE